jgi:isocitrate/isopropylmalate dehydrogenase
MSIPVTIAYGDQDFPEFIDAALLVLREAGAQLTIETIEVGSRIYGMDYNKGILPSSFSSLTRTRRLLIGGSHLPSKEGYEHVCSVIRAHFGLGDEHREEYGISIDDDAAIRAISHVNDDFAMFEAADETPASALLAATMLLEHTGQEAMAETIRSTMKNALRAGLREPSLLQRWLGKSPSAATLFAESVCHHLAKKPSEKLTSDV